MNETITIIIQGSRSGDAQYTLEMDKGEVLALKMSLSNREKEKTANDVVDELTN